jgi:hypothetical protein
VDLFRRQVEGCFWVCRAPTTFLPALITVHLSAPIPRPSLPPGAPGLALIAIPRFRFAPHCSHTNLTRFTADPIWADRSSSAPHAALLLVTLPLLRSGPLLSDPACPAGLIRP